MYHCGLELKRGLITWRRMFTSRFIFSLISVWHRLPSRNLHCVNCVCNHRCISWRNHRLPIGHQLEYRVWHNHGHLHHAGRRHLHHQYQHQTLWYRPDVWVCCRPAHQTLSWWLPCSDWPCDFIDRWLWHEQPRHQPLPRSRMRDLCQKWSRCFL